MFKVGDKVKIRYFNKIPDHWNSHGRMNHWMGQIVTIREIFNDDEKYRIEEDKKEHYGIGWCWERSDFIPLDSIEMLIEKEKL